MDYEKEIPFGAFDSELMHQEISIPEGFTATIDGNKIILTKTESEDEKIRKALIEYFNEQCDMSDWNGVYGYQVVAWLEKQGKEDSFIQQAYEQGYTEGKRIERKHWIEKQNFSEDYNSIDPQFGKPIEQNPAEWSEEDKKLTDVDHEYFSELLENNDSEDINDYAYQVAYCMSHDWIEETATWDDVQKACKLGAEWKEKHGSSKDWNEEDETNSYHLKTLLENLTKDIKHEFRVISDNDRDKYTAWLESLKDRNLWKPSDEQINALSVAVKHGQTDDPDALKKLLEQLKKLTE